jgi:multisubunit Na+/H+ antiporter MnhG subunit
MQQWLNRSPTSNPMVTLSSSKFSILLIAAVLIFLVAATALTTEFQEFIGALTTTIISPVPADLLLRVYAESHQ